MTENLIPILAQFGPAGLIGLLWLAERRHAAAREKQLGEAHRKLMSDNHLAATLLDVVRDNTRAIASLEHTQRQLIELTQGLMAGAIVQKRKGPGT